MNKNRIKGLKLLKEKKVKFPSSPEEAELEIFDNVIQRGIIG